MALIVTPLHDPYSGNLYTWEGQPSVVEVCLSARATVRGRDGDESFEQEINRSP